MSVLNIDDLLREVDSESPCGQNLEYDPEFLEFEQATLGKPEVQYGDSLTPAVSPEWKMVKKGALSLFNRSKDFRVAVPLSRALLALDGMAGFADGLSLIQRLLAERWETVHPQLDPDDALDSTLRINSLAGLAELATTIKELKEATLITLPGLGPLSLRDLEIANGELQVPEDQKKQTISSIDASIADMDLDNLKTSLDAIKQAHDSVAAIEAILVQRVGTVQALNLDALAKNLRRGFEFLSERFNRRTVAGTVNQTDEFSVNGASNLVSQSAGSSVPKKSSIHGEICSREDVTRMLENICQYYARWEPSSPVPLLLRRAKRLVPKDFFEIMEDLAPDGLSQIMRISGTPSDS